MNEKDIRDRIGQFLKKTARTVIVPASMGLGLSSSACNSNALRPAGDAGLDSGATQADAPRTGPDQADAAIKNDVPLMMVPYVVAMIPDAAVDAGPGPDADRDFFPDARTDISYALPPYLAPIPPDAAADVAREASREDAGKDTLPDVRADLPYPPPPYLILPMPTGDPPSPSSTPDKK